MKVELKYAGTEKKKNKTGLKSRQHRINEIRQWFSWSQRSHLGIKYVWIEWVTGVRVYIYTRRPRIRTGRCIVRLSLEVLCPKRRDTAVVAFGASQILHITSLTKEVWFSGAILEEARPLPTWHK